jgi:hypothetical protein
MYSEYFTLHQPRSRLDKIISSNNLDINRLKPPPPVEREMSVFIPPATAVFEAVPDSASGLTDVLTLAGMVFVGVAQAKRFRGPRTLRA